MVRSGRDWSRWRPISVWGNEELIRDGENGFLVPAGNEEQLTGRLETLVIQSELRKAFGASAKKSAQSFTVERVCGEYERLYMYLLQEKGIGQAELVRSSHELG